MTISTPMAAVTDAIEKNMTLTTTVTATMTMSATMINNGATTGVPAITITAMTGMIAVPDVTTTATMIATAAGATTTGAPHITVTSFVTWTHRHNKNTRPRQTTLRL